MRRPRDSDSYGAVHKRLDTRRGKARVHPCSAPECERQATEWAWLRTGPTRTGEWHGKPVSWGLDVADYSPMCRSHASMLDRGGTLTHCPQAHVRAEHGALPDGTCRECRRLYDQRLWANRRPNPD